MKWLFEIIFFCFIFSSAVGQKVVIKPEQSNELYLGIDNEVSIAVENTSCNSIEVEVDNGTIKGNKGYYIYKASKVGVVDITIFKRNKGELRQIAKSYFKVKNLPGYEAELIGINGNRISKNVLLAHEYLAAVLEHSYINARLKIDSFNVCIISYINNSDTCIYKTFINIGSKFSSQVMSSFQAINNKDIIILKDITASYSDGASIVLNPLIFTIIDNP